MRRMLFWGTAASSVPLIGASKNNYTASVYYEKGWFGGRVTYTYRGKFYTSTEGNTQDQVWEQPFGTLDANVTFGIGDHVSKLWKAIDPQLIRVRHNRCPP